MALVQALGLSGFMVPSRCVSESSPLVLRSLRLREVTRCDQGHIAGKRQGLGLLDSLPSAAGLPLLVRLDSAVVPSPRHVSAGPGDEGGGCCTASVRGSIV